MESVCCCGFWGYLLLGGGDLTVKALAAFAGRSRDKIKFRANVRRNQRMGKMIGIKISGLGKEN